MMQSMESNLSSNDARTDNRKSMDLFSLIEIDRSSAVDSVRLDDGYETDGVFASGEMREVCPQCQANHLKLVLRQKRVRYAHLFCECCSKCFDARYPDGSSALILDK
jgi:DNA-directed RNA polymerase subunit M/transcription elongation factor TFIIS